MAALFSRLRNAFMDAAYPCVCRPEASPRCGCVNDVSPEVSSERPPHVGPECPATNSAQSIGQALWAVNLMLQLDNCSHAQRTDLLFVREVLKAIQDERQGQDAQVAAIKQSDGLDECTQAYLLGFGTHVKQKRTLRDVARGVVALIRKQRGERTRKVSRCISDSRELVGLDDWCDFDIFRVARDNNVQPLLAVAYSVLARRRLISHFNFNPSLLFSFLDRIEDLYGCHSYHNATHAADVMQGSHVLLLKGAQKCLSELEILAVLLGAACHDVGHHGVTNDFRIASGDEDAITYNDQAVNENMHLAVTYRTLQRPECDFLRLALTPKQRQALRGMVIQSVLATDMAVHFKNLEALKALVKDKSGNVHKWDTSVPLLQLVLHGADISNPSRPPALARRWTDLILEEFFLQGDRERSLGREPSPLCDRRAVSKAGSQVGFIGFIVRPTFEMLGNFCDATVMLSNLQAYKDFWEEELATEKQLQATTAQQASTATVESTTDTQRPAASEDG